MRHAAMDRAEAAEKASRDWERGARRLMARADSAEALLAEAREIAERLPRPEFTDNAYDRAISELATALLAKLLERETPR